MYLSSNKIIIFSSYRLVGWLVGKVVGCTILSVNYLVPLLRIDNSKYAEKVQVVKKEKQESVRVRVAGFHLKVIVNNDR